jgi:HD superfamily phosphohydrolase YqeK
LKANNEQIQELASAIVEGMAAKEVEQYCKGLVHEMAKEMSQADIEEAEKIALETLNAEVPRLVDPSNIETIH